MYNREWGLTQEAAAWAGARCVWRAWCGCRVVLKGYDIILDQVDKISQLIKAVEVLKSVSLSPDGFAQTLITGFHPKVLLQLVWVGA